MNNFNKLKPWVYKNILEIIDLNPLSALEKNIDIQSIQISEELYRKINKYLRENSLITHTRYGSGGRHEGAKYYMYTYKFKITDTREGKYFINKGGALGYEPKGIFFKGFPEEKKKKEALTPTMLQLFYGFLKKYPEHILNINWCYQEKEEEPFDD